jgi:hypothetical protein
VFAAAAAATAAGFDQLPAAGRRHLPQTLPAALLNCFISMFAVAAAAAVAGFDQLSAAGWKRLALAWPRLTIVRLGGSAAANAAALKALPHILPGLTQPPAAAAAADEAAALRGEAAGSSSSSSA